MTLFLILLIVAVLVGMIWLWRSQQTPHRRRRLSRQTAATPARPGGLDKLQKNEMFWGVEISQAGCESARALLGRQYTFDEAPELPLPGCESAACTCQFNGLKDHRGKPRRTREDRRNDIRFDKDRPERRSRRNRRRGEKWDDHSY
jgi:hypothetical protein